MLTLTRLVRSVRKALGGKNYDRLHLKTSRTLQWSPLQNGASLSLSTSLPSRCPPHMPQKTLPICLTRPQVAVIRIFLNTCLPFHQHTPSRNRLGRRGARSQPPCCRKAKKEQQRTRRRAEAPRSKARRVVWQRLRTALTRDWEPVRAWVVLGTTATVSFPYTTITAVVTKPVRTQLPRLVGKLVILG
jgi:hypothetical protein